MLSQARKQLQKQNSRHSNTMAQASQWCKNREQESIQDLERDILKSEVIKVCRQKVIVEEILQDGKYSY